MIKVFCGWDPRDITGYNVCRQSLMDHASIRVSFKPLIQWKLRRGKIFNRPYRVDERGQMWDIRENRTFSTEFSYTRFLIPYLCNYKDEWVVFCEPDMMWRADIAELLELTSRQKSLICVKHNHRPVETKKMNDIRQETYHRKNWSSLMVINPARNVELTIHRVGTSDKEWLHGLSWLRDDEIGELPEEWNWLEGWSSPDLEPKIVHYTRSLPDMTDQILAYNDDWWKIADEFSI